MIDLVFPEKCRKSMYLQVFANERVYKEETFFTRELCRICSSMKLDNVLELGCGIGRGSMFLFKTLHLYHTKFFLLDGNSGNVQVGGINTSSSDFYNEEEATKEFCLANWLTNFEYINAECIIWPENVKFDFVFSMAAIGFHWPVSLYLERIAPFVHIGAKLMFQSRSMFDTRNSSLVGWNCSQIEYIKQTGLYKTVLFADDTDSSAILIERI